APGGIAPTASSRLPFDFLPVISPRAIVVTPSNLMEWTIDQRFFLLRGDRGSYRRKRLRSLRMSLSSGCQPHLFIHHWHMCGALGHLLSRSTMRPASNAACSGQSCVGDGPGGVWRSFAGCWGSVCSADTATG